ncbi:hypothetical protein FRC09_015538 [Ceratobasidium sp. 395]|nr:hypothetical protein FRC09_015538 [Ceratobasidium sp. 395]
MRVKQLWSYVPLPSTLKLVWDRLTFSRLTAIYFAIAVIHCFIQVIFQISALYINTQAAHVIAHIAATDPNSTPGFAILSKNGPLRSCTGMPGSTGSTPCRMVWAGKVSPDAFGSYPDDPSENNSTTLSTSSSSVVSATPTTSLISSALTTSSSSGIVRATGVSTGASSPAATSVVIQTFSIVSRSGSSSFAVSTSLFTSVASSSSVSTAIRATPAPPSPNAPGAAPPSAGPPAPASPAPLAGPAKRMYIPDRIPGAKNHMFSRRDISLTPVFSEFNGTFEGVKLNGLTATNHDGVGDHETDEAFVSSVCVQVLQWPLQKLWNTQREDAVFIGFQFWVLGMSIVALLNESVPHIIATFLTHVLVTGWSVFQIVHTASFRSEFNRLTTRGACGGVNLLPTYWKARANAEIPVLVFNVVALIGSAYMSWRLLKTFGWLTFKRVGASFEINRIYRLVLSLGIVLQLSLFFLVVSIALWLEQLYHGPAPAETSLAVLYKTIVIVQLIALGPWLIMGWYAVRREMRKTMIVFLVLSALFIVAWAAMFVCRVWRLTFMTWMFFRVMAVTAATLTTLAFGLGIVCWLNFGKDFPKHLQIHDDPEGSDFIPAQLSYDPEKGEKVDFPTQNSIPTFSDAFSSRPSSIASSSAHSHSDSAPTIAAPRMVARPPTYQNFEVERSMSVRHGPTRSNTMESSSTVVSVRDPFEQDLERVASRGSRRTVQSTTASLEPVQSAVVGMGKRWVIE